MTETYVLEFVADCYKKYIVTKEQQKVYNRMRQKIKKYKEIDCMVMQNLILDEMFEQV